MRNIFIFRYILAYLRCISMVEYNLETDKMKQEYLHNWQPPCSCGIPLDRIDLEKKNSEYTPLKKEELHNWQPPCSCGIPLDRVDLEKKIVE